MWTHWSTPTTMKLVFLVFQLGLILQADAQTSEVCITSNTNRPPENSDITVICGTQYVDLSIYICPMYQALYNESLMVLNGQQAKSECYGQADWTVTPPVLKFRFQINESSLSFCGNKYKINSETGTGQFADFSSVQNVNISGTVSSIDPAAGMITYRPQILYKFSCNYPMQYLLNNTKLGVTGVSVAIKDNNGSFISTLSLLLFRDSLYSQPLVIPQTGLNLKTKIHVAVKATNLTERFNVLLDRCYATTSPYPMHTTYYDLFVGCTRDAQTKVDLNGVSQQAHFSFEAFRFLEHKNLSVSTFYLHCATRLCEASACSSLMPNCLRKRRRREVDDVPTNATITSPLIIVGKETVEEVKPPGSLTAPLMANYSSPVVAIIVCIVVISVFIAALTIYFGCQMRRKKRLLK